MSFFDRFVLLAKADAHGVLDSLEDTGLLLRQCLREAEAELSRNQAQREEMERWLGKLASQKETLQKRMETLDGEIRLAIGEQKDPLARFSIRRLLACERQRAELEEQAQAACDERERLDERVASQEIELDELRQQVEAHLAREGAADAGSSAAASNPECARFVRDEEVELELLRRRQEIESGGATR